MCEKTVFGYTGYLSDRWKKVFQNVARTEITTRRKRDFLICWPAVIVLVAAIAVSGRTIFRAIQGTISIGSAVVLIQVLITLDSIVVWGISFSIRTTFERIGFFQDLLKFTHLKEDQKTSGIRRHW